MDDDDTLVSVFIIICGQFSRWLISRHCASLVVICYFSTGYVNDVFCRIRVLRNDISFFYFFCVCFSTKIIQDAQLYNVVILSHFQFKFRVERISICVEKIRNGRCFIFFLLILSFCLFKLLVGIICCVFFYYFKLILMLFTVHKLFYLL